MSLGERATADQGTVFVPLLDGKPILLPKGTTLAVAQRPLAQAIVQEWAQVGGGAFTPEDLPLTRIAGTMLERVRPDPDQTRKAILAFGQDDAFCYAAEPCPPEAQTLLGWLEGRGLSPSITQSVMPVQQSDGYIQYLRGWLNGCGYVELATLGVLVQVGGSLLIGYALLEGGLNLAQATAIVTADERRQEALWGVDTALSATIAQRHSDLCTAMTFLALARS